MFVQNCPKNLKSKYESMIASLISKCNETRDFLLEFKF